MLARRRDHTASLANTVIAMGQFVERPHGGAAVRKDRDHRRLRRPGPVVEADAVILRPDVVGPVRESEPKIAAPYLPLVPSRITKLGRLALALFVTVIGDHEDSQ